MQLKNEPSSFGSSTPIDMNPFLIKATVRNWKDSVVCSIELLESFVDGVKKQAIESISKFETQKETHVLTEALEEGHIECVDTHQGLDDRSWDIQAIFRSYFPNLRRRSALLTMCGFLNTS